MNEQITPQPGDIVRVTYAGVWEGQRMLFTGNGDGDRWHNILPASAQVEIISQAGEEPPAPRLCQMNRRGDKAEPAEHFYWDAEGGGLRCVFCSQPAPWSGEAARAYRSPDGRLWKRTAETNEYGVALYETPSIERRYTAVALETLYADQGDIEAVDDVKPRAYVYNARSVNRAPGTAVKHIPSGNGRTICPSNFAASKPMSKEEAAQLTLCGGCRRALLALFVDQDAQPARAGAAIGHGETGICNHA
ncbi:hypothetical protein [Streptomyces eurythermus]